MPAAQVREATDIPGTSVRTAWLCRDKPAMKDALRAAGVPTAESARRLLGRREGVRGPRRLPADRQAPRGRRRLGHGARRQRRRARAGAAALRRARARLGRDRGVHRGARGLLRHDHPRRPGRPRLRDPLLPQRPRGDAAPVDLAAVHHDEPGRRAAPGYDEVRELGRRVIDALGIETSATHMEWFYGPKGLKFSEIGCRPPGVGAWDLYSAANDMDLYREWAHVVTHGRPEQPMQRSYAAGHHRAPPRPRRARRGLRRASTRSRAIRASGSSTGTSRRSGTATQPVEAGYMANAWVRLRHPDYDTAARRCSTTSAARSRSTPAELPGATGRRRSCSGRNDSRRRCGRRCAAWTARGPWRWSTAGWQEREAEDAELRGLLDDRGGQPQPAQPRPSRRSPATATSRRHPRAPRPRCASCRRSTASGSRPRWDAVFARDAPVVEATTLPMARGGPPIEALRDVDDWYADAGRAERTRRPRRRGRPVERGVGAPASRGRARSSASARLVDRRRPRARPAGDRSAVRRRRPVGEHPVIAWSAGAMVVTERSSSSTTTPRTGGTPEVLRRRPRAGCTGSSRCPTPGAACPSTTRADGALRPPLRGQRVPAARRRRDRRCSVQRRRGRAGRRASRRRRTRVDGRRRGRRPRRAA